MPRIHGRKNTYRAYKRSKYRRRGRRPRRNKSARTIQRVFRNYRARKSLGRAIKSRAISRFNYTPQANKVKTFTILCPDGLLNDPGTGSYAGQGLWCTKGNSTQGELLNVFELGMFRKVTTNPGIAIWSPELLNMFQLYKYAKIVSASVSCMPYRDNLSTTVYGPAPTTITTNTFSSPLNYCSYLQSVIDTGQFKNIDDLQNYATSIASNVASTNPDDYFASKSSRLHQVSYDNKKSLKTKIMQPTLSTNWSQQRFVWASAEAATPLQPIKHGTYRCTQPWLDTSILTKVANGTVNPVAPPAASNIQPYPNIYASTYALTRMPPVSFYGKGFPQRYQALANQGPTILQTPIFKCIVSITVAFKTPTIRI